MPTDRILELAMLAAYLVLLLWIGLRSARNIFTSDDYTLAGRTVGWTVVLATTAATMIGGGASVGMVSRVFEVGIAAAFVTCGWHLQLLFTGLFVAPKLRGLNLITVGDYFHLKFGPLARELAVVNCIIFMVAALTAQIAAMGTVTNTVLGIPYSTALLIGAAVTVFYATVGGMRAVVTTDVLQFAILVVGLSIAAAILVSRYGGIEPMLALANPGQAALTSSWSTAQVVSLFFAFLLGETFCPPYTVRCFIAKDSNQARWGVAGAGIFLLLFMPIITFTLGTAAQIDPAVQSAVTVEQQQVSERAELIGQPMSEEDALDRGYQVAFPALVRSTFHPAFAGVMIAAIIAAVMSSADSNLSALATLVMEDIYRRHVNKQATDRQLLRVAQVTTLVSGVAAATCAFFFNNVADILVFTYDFWAPAMILPFLVAIFWYRRNRIRAVVIAMIAGMISTVVWRFVLNSPGDIGPALFGVAAASVVFLLAVPFTKSQPATGLFEPSATEDTP